MTLNTRPREEAIKIVESARIGDRIPGHSNSRQVGSALFVHLNLLYSHYVYRYAERSLGG